MSVWRRKAIECLPELRAEFQKPETGIYDIFIELFAALKAAHAEADPEKLQRIYAYAEWCFRSKKQDLWNAAGIAFYEHLIDYDETKAAMPAWVKPDIYADIRGLLEVRMPEKELLLLDKQIGYRPQKR